MKVSLGRKDRPFLSADEVLDHHAEECLAFKSFKCL